MVINLNEEQIVNAISAYIEATQDKEAAKVERIKLVYCYRGSSVRVKAQVEVKAKVVEVEAVAG